MDAIKEVKELKSEGIILSGKFWVGDPCYVLGKDSFWQEFCDKFHNVESSYCVVRLNSGLEFYVFSTAYGDGCYEFQDSELGVDSGLLAVIPLEVIKEIDYKDSCKDSGIIVNLKAEKVKPANQKGNFWVGNNLIDTNY